MYVEINLIIASWQLKVNQYMFLLTDGGELPSRMFWPEDGSLYQVSCMLADENLCIVPQWLQFNLVDVTNNDDILYIYYVVLIPEQIQHKKGQWVYFNAIESKEIMAKIMEATQK